MTFWYEAKPKPFDLPNDGEPVAYFSNPMMLQNIQEISGGTSHA